jgi:GT2 family glycosyltransferase
MISIIIPIIRPEKAKRCIEAISKEYKFTCSDSIEYVFDFIAEQCHFEIIAEEDKDHVGCPAMVKKLVDKARGDTILFLGDDTIPQPGFLKAAMDAMDSLPDGWGVVGLNTQDDRPGVGFNDHAHWMASRQMLDHIPGGEFFSTEYKHCYGDDELKDIAIELGRWTVAEDCKILHDHPVNATAECDEGYQRAYDNDAFMADWRTYCRRKIDRRGFRLGIATPLTGRLGDNWFQSSYRRAIYSCMKIDGFPPMKEYEPDVPIGHFARDIATNRNDVFRQALDDGISHVIMTDTDQILPEDVFIKLAKWAARGKDCVIAPVHRRYDPFELILMRGEDPDKYQTVPDEEKYSGKLIEVDAGGGGCFMVDMKKVLELDFPYFSLDDKTPAGYAMGEDVSFFWKLRQKGCRIWADTSIEIGHIAEMVINREFHEIWMKLNKNAFKTEEVK